MVSSVTDSQSSNILAELSPQQTTLSKSGDSFTAQLTSALEGDRSVAAEGSNPGTNARSTQSQESGARQVLATPAAPADSSGATFFGFVASPAIATPAAATTG